MPRILDTSGKTWTYGCEHEFADWDTSKGWPEGMGRDPEPNICNSNGIAADPTTKSYKFGGEVNTRPSSGISGQGSQLVEFLRMHPNSKANWRCGLHVHIRIPGLRDNLKVLKDLAMYISRNTEVYDFVDPLPKPTVKQYPIPEEYKQAKKRYNWMRMSHMTVIPHYRVIKQQKAKTFEEFLALEVPWSKAGKPLYHAQPRAAISLRQLLQTDTIEFRHFPATLDPDEVFAACKWCREYLLCFFNGVEAIDVVETFVQNRHNLLPKLDRIYEHWQEVRWKATTITRHSRPEIEAAIKRILAEDSARGYPPGCTR